ncbi:MAG: DeoR/GlpR family DNA-binding transcription regulator, partial [Balneolaceae bacterium]
PTLEEKQKLFQKEKQRIGEKAIEMINSGDSILLDSGTTAMEIAHRLTGKKNLTVMTNAINIALKLGSFDNLNVMLTGGVLRKESFSLVGPEAEATISNYYFDKLFLGVDGLDIKFGLTTPNPMEAQLNRTMVDRAQQVIAIADSSKFGKHSFSYICDVDVISTIITDVNISSQYEVELLRRNINVIKV